MATYVFENMTQAQADAVTTNDIIAVATATTNARNIGVSIATQVGVDAITLTVGSKSLAFGATQLSSISTQGNIVFNDNSSLILGSNAADTTLAGTTAPNTVYLFGGNDVFTSTDSESFIYGLGGSDTITGGSTASHLYGFNASGGSDGADQITGGSAGDYIQGNAGDDTLDGGDGSDRILGGAGNDNATGGLGNDSLNGNLGTDTLDGGDGNDLVRGGGGADSVSGGDGNDDVRGDLGADTLNGGLGADNLTGGEGNDIFNFDGIEANRFTDTVSGAVAYDTILDYTDGQDEIRITSGGSTFGDMTGSGEINIGAAGATFTTVSAATTYAQQLLDANTQTNDIAIVKVGGDTYVFWDSTGTQLNPVDSYIKLQGVTDTSLFTNADFS